MAKAVAIVEPQDAAPQKGPSLVVQIVVVLVLSLLAAGAGYFSGGMLKGETAPAEATADAHAPAGGHDDKKAGQHGEAVAEPEDPNAEDLKRGIFNMPPITTNLAAPSDTWIRLELAAVFEGEVVPAVADTVHQDILAYLRTVKLHQVEGASGFLHLKDDIQERAIIRSEGKVKAVLIRTIVFE